MNISYSCSYVFRAACNREHLIYSSECLRNSLWVLHSSNRYCYSCRLQVVPLSGSECKGQVKRNRHQVKVMEGKDRKRFFLCFSSSSCHPYLSLAFWYIVLVSEVVSWKWWLPFRAWDQLFSLLAQWLVTGLIIIIGVAQQGKLKFLLP